MSRDMYSAYPGWQQCVLPTLCLWCLDNFPCTLSFLHSHIQFIVRGICYCCEVPTSQHFDHPLHSKNDNPPCRFDDILKPLSLVLYPILSLRNIVLDHVGISSETFWSSQDYAAWLGEVHPGSDFLLNLWEVCHAYIHLLMHQRLVYVSIFFKLLTLSQSSSNNVL